MNMPLTSMPGYRYCDYLLVLSPHEDLRNKIMKIKKEFNENYNIAIPINGKPHITLATWKVLQMMEDKIINRLKVAAMGMPPFKVHLKDYGSFPSHTIFINVTSKLPIQNLVKEIRKSRKLMKSPEFDPYFTDDPRLVI